MDLHLACAVAPREKPRGLGQACAGVVACSPRRRRRDVLKARARRDAVDATRKKDAACAPHQRVPRPINSIPHM